MSIRTVEACETYADGQWRVGDLTDSRRVFFASIDYFVNELDPIRLTFKNRGHSNDQNLIESSGPEELPSPLSFLTLDTQTQKAMIDETEKDNMSYPFKINNDTVFVGDGNARGHVSVAEPDGTWSQYFWTGDRFIPVYRPDAPTNPARLELLATARNLFLSSPLR